ncbi:MAG TPA: tRNA epoxyqueuosine(34) reductase QueG, partial [Anaeromyxobacteraceae bacterium]|nr:tRNA epoxyqueuosine(34) reductase QueG [Anaeromyxobacteraceae bacterium]
RLLAGVRSVVAVALSYHAGEAAPVSAGWGEVARYARGRDYHVVMKKRLAALRGEIAGRDPGARTFAAADVAPVMEKVWAQRAGLGWIGKNGCLITPEFGSWVVLATLLVDRGLEPDEPHPERCGRCEACLPACPTGAIPEPGFVDARRCLSFWTIERRGAIPADLAARLGGRVFGCDACQTACPWNEGLAPSADVELVPRPGQLALDLEGLLRLTEQEYRRRFHGTALARARYDGLVRNAILLAGESGDARWAPWVEPHQASPHPGVRAAAEWALARLAAR